MRLESLLASSAVHEVWRALDPSGRPVAYKLPKPAWADRPEAIAALHREAAVLAALQHPHVVRSHGLVPHDGRLGLATELLTGGDLVALAGAAPRHWQDAFLGTLGALRAVHGAGWVHRDVKARNVLLGADGRARLIDFASAERLGAPRPMGGVTPGHVRPAAAREPVSAADDAFAAAALLFELARGPLPSRPDEALDASRAGALAALTPAIEKLLTAREEPDSGSLSELLNVIESVAPPRT